MRERRVNGVYDALIAGRFASRSGTSGVFNHLNDPVIHERQALEPDRFRHDSGAPDRAGTCDPLVGWALRTAD